VREASVAEKASVAGNNFVSKEAPSVDASGADTLGADTLASTNLEPVFRYNYNGLPVDGLGSLMPSTIDCIVPTCSGFGAWNIYSFATDTALQYLVADGADVGAGAGAGAADAAFTSDIVTQEKNVVVAEPNTDQHLNIFEIPKIKHLKKFHFDSSNVTNGNKTSMMGSSEFCHMHFFDKQSTTGAIAFRIKTTVREVGIVFKFWMLLIVAGLFLVVRNGQQIVMSCIDRLSLAKTRKKRFKSTCWRQFIYIYSYKMLFWILLALSVEKSSATFKPRNRDELLGAVIGCLGACTSGSYAHGTDIYQGYTYCKNGPYLQGTGVCPIFESTTVPTGQGDSIYGSIGTWDVSSVTNMRYGKFLSFTYFEFCILNTCNTNIYYLKLTIIHK
jgi:hypothetical protein